MELLFMLSFGIFMGESSASRRRRINLTQPFPAFASLSLLSLCLGHVRRTDPVDLRRLSLLSVLGMSSMPCTRAAHAGTTTAVVHAHTGRRVAVPSAEGATGADLHHPVPVVRARNRGCAIAHCPLLPLMHDTQTLGTDTG